MSRSEEVFVFFVFFLTCCLALFLAIGAAGIIVWSLRLVFG